MCQALLEGVDVNAADEKRRTALHFAATKGNLAVLKMLLDHGANVDSRDALGNTALCVESPGPESPSSPAV